jgi:N-acetylglucosamine-6-sulfatase
MRLRVLLVAGVAGIAAVSLAITGGGFFGATERGGAQVAEPPNIVFVMTDDLDEQSMQQLSGIRNIMGSNGTTFENAYVTYSLCCPSRATILRGQYPHNHHIIGNSPPQGGAKKFRESGLDKSTIATWLNSNYRTKYIGKYMNGYGGLLVPPGWDEWFVLMGDPKDGRINQDGREIALGGHSTDVFANNASDFIRRSAPGPQPFFVTVGTVAPHSPPPVADRYKGFFGNTALPRPPNFDEMDVADKPRYIQSYARLTNTKITSLQSQYRQRLRSMLSVEDLLRQIIATLRDTDELDNTYIFFTSDNGFHMGNHRVYPGGKWLPYEEDIGVPLMVRGPGVPANTTRKQLVINNDFAPTIADLADAQIPAFVDGRSFAPLLSSSAPSSWRAAFLEEGWLDTNTGATRVPTHKGVHTQDHMLVEYDTGERELYDLIQDPYQLQSKSRTGNESLYSALETRLDALRACSGAACRSAEWTR